MKKTVILFCVLLFVAGTSFFVINQRQNNPEPSQKIPVAASFYPLAFFAQEIAGEHANIRILTPAGAEPHDYELTAQDRVAIEKSRLLILNGNGFEPWGESIVQNIDTQKTHIISASEGIILQQIEKDGVKTPDPHIWLSPKLAIKITEAIENSFVQIDPSFEKIYRANAATLKIKLTTLDDQYVSGLSRCGERSFITSHAAFGYLANEYRLSQVSITGASPDMEPSPKQLAELATFARSKGIRYIFFEELVNSKLSDTLAREVGAQTLVLNPIEGLGSEAIQAGKTYITEMEANLKNLQTALQCTPTNQ